MPPVWSSPLRSRERILAFGPIGTGKTTAAAQIVKRLHPDAKVTVIDCDNAWERMLDTDYPDLDVEIIRVRGWEEFLEAFGNAVDNADRDDWVIVDDMSYPWAWVLRWYIQKTHGEELPDFMIDHRIKQISNDAKATGGQDAILVEWNYVNQVWNGEIADRIVNAGCHLFLCAPAKKLRTDSQGDRREVREFYEQVSHKPDSQWRLGHQMQTVLFFDQGKVSGRKITSLKDRGRELWDEEAWSDFGREYLKLAGWKMEVVK